MTKDTTDIKAPPKPRKKAAKKKASKKKATKKKPAKKATRKKSVKKKTTRKKAKKKPAAVAKREEHPDDLDTQHRVWEAYARLRSRAAVARELGMAPWIVRDVLECDLPRVRRMVDEYVENYVAEYERAGARSLNAMHGVLTLVETNLAEIDTAAREGRLTTIRDKDGFPMPVLDAIQFVVMARLLPQVENVAHRALEASASYRRGETLPAHPDDPDAGQGTHDFNTMTDQQIVDFIESAGLTVPPILAAKVKRVRNELEKQKAAAEAS